MRSELPASDDVFMIVLTVLGKLADKYTQSEFLLDVTEEIL